MEEIGNVGKWPISDEFVDKSSAAAKKAESHRNPLSSFYEVG
jgi:hypothetical protein